MVYFVGAGSGAVDLITVRGKNLLQKADVIIYAGSLVNPALLQYAKEDCQIHNSAYMTLDEVIEVMRGAESAGQMTVRLHTGDTSLYSTLREQADRLRELSIGYEICPGVSSFCGAAAALGAEYTVPGVSQTVIISRMAGRTPVRDQENMKSLAAHRATMVLFLSAGLLDELSLELTAGGYPPDTPAAIVYKATWDDEKVVRTTVGNLAGAALESGITKTAVVAVGDFLGDDYELSRLYDPAFTTGFRRGSGGGDGR